jgi:hypothetical protein
LTIVIRRDKILFRYFNTFIGEQQAVSLPWPANIALNLLPGQLPMQAGDGMKEANWHRNAFTGIS